MFKLRFWWVIFKAVLSRGIQATSRVAFWVTPFECDLNLHCNNASYLKYMDLGRWDLLLRQGVFRPLVRARLQPVAVRVEIDFKRALPPLAYFQLDTHVEAIHERSFTIRQNFVQRRRSRDNHERHEQIIASALVKVVFLHQGRAVSTAKFIEMLPPQLKVDTSLFDSR